MGATYLFVALLRIVARSYPQCGNAVRGTYVAPMPMCLAMLRGEHYRCLALETKNVQAATVSGPTSQVSKAWHLKWHPSNDNLELIKGAHNATEKTTTNGSWI